MVSFHPQPAFFALFSTLSPSILHFLSPLGYAIRKTMANLEIHPLFQLLFFLAMIFAAVFVQDATGSRVHVGHHIHPTAYRTPSAQRELNLKDNPKRLLIGSIAPRCTYNECRGCKYKCRAEPVPVEGNDPINSAYHYKCVCHG